jgi:hypothetical protein
VRLRPGGKDGGALNADRRSTLTLAKAEEHTGIRQQQVSRWRFYETNEQMKWAYEQYDLRHRTPTSALQN